MSLLFNDKRLFLEFCFGLIEVQQVTKRLHTRLQCSNLFKRTALELGSGGLYLRLGKLFHPTPFKVTVAHD